MTKAEFEQKHGSIAIIEMATKRLHECRYNFSEIDYKVAPPLCTGNIWNIGYFAKSQNPIELDLDFTSLDIDSTFTKKLIAILKDTIESSDTDCNYYPFILQLNDLHENTPQKILQSFKQSIGLSDNPDGGLGEKRDCLDILNVTENKFFTTSFHEDELDEIEEYLEPGDIEAHQKACKLFLDTFNDVYKITIKPSKGGRFIVAFPVFVFGISESGLAVGCFTIRVET